MSPHIHSHICVNYMYRVFYTIWQHPWILSKPALHTKKACLTHDDVIKWQQFPPYWPFVRGIRRSPVNSPHKGQWRGALMFSMICARTNGWIDSITNRQAGDLRRHRAHYDVTVMWFAKQTATVKFRIDGILHGLSWSVHHFSWHDEQIIFFCKWQCLMMICDICWLIFDLIGSSDSWMHSTNDNTPPPVGYDNSPWASYQTRKITSCACPDNVFPATAG